MNERFNTRHIPALDGLRGAAVILVLLHHFTIYRPETGADSWLAAVPLIGWCGVDLFFVLSGFLITGILLDSRDSDRYFTSFYARRSLRIFPLYYLVIFVALVILPLLPALQLVLAGPYPNPPAWPYWLYLTNISVAERGLVHGWIDVAWSLAIEEQFYIVWALVVYFCPPRWLGWLCVAIVVVEPLTRAAALDRKTDPLAIYVLTWFRLDSLAIGALLAWLHRRGGLHRLSRPALPAALIGIAGLVLITYDAGDSWWWNPRMQEVGYTLIAVTAAAMVVATVVKPAGSRWTWVLSLGWLRAFGKYSYCLYLIHLPVMRAMREYVFDPFDYEMLATAPWIGQGAFYVSATAPAFALAWVSWRVFEAPILRLKERFPY
ncbi:MAG: acyltransferase [Vicinamibacterales bacterium]